MVAVEQLSVDWASALHYDQIVRLFAFCMPSEKWTVEDLEAFSGRPKTNNTIKVLLSEGKFVHGAMLYTRASDIWRLRRIAVWPKYQRLGLGSTLLSSLCRPHFGRRRVTTRVRENNTAAVLFLRQFGFKFDPDRPRELDADGETEFYEFMFPDVERTENGGTGASKV